MRLRATLALGIVAVAIGHPTLRAQRRPPRPDLQGTWNGSTLTPLQRPPEFRDRPAFTQAEAAEYVKHRADRVRERLPSASDRLTQVDIDDADAEAEAMAMDGLRTSLIVEPADGMLPPLLPAARARLAARPKRSFDDPELLGLAERCLLGNFGAGGSMSSPPMVPSEVIPSFYQLVQTDTAVMIFSEWIHDARIVRINGEHQPPAIRKWLGDSIGRYEGDTLVVDTTNFRSDTRNLNSSERLHVVERFTRVDAKTLRYRVTVEDPETWAAAWTAEWPFKAIDTPLFGVDCHEGNYAIENFLRGARAEDRRAREPR